MSLDSAEAEPFVSVGSLRSAHAELLRRHQAEGETAELVAQARSFLASGAATGALIADEEERWSIQSLLDYWGATLYRVGEPAFDVTLADFDPELAPALPDDICPYRGLDSFQEQDAPLFFGRRRAVNELLQHLQLHRLIALVGPSGSGKSSLVRAGLIPVLKAGGCAGSADWLYLSPIVPGSEPVGALDRALSDVAEGSNRPLLIVVDQFEEVFTLCTNEHQRNIFIDRLVTFATDEQVPHHIVLTMRSDFEPFVTRSEVIYPLFEAGKVVLSPLSAAELRETIERPAEWVGLRFEAGVVSALLQDILGEPAALPLLQFTLLQLWEQRERNRVTMAAYKRVGGGRLALARTADALYARLIPEEQVTAKRILLRMVRPSEGLEVTSNRIRRRDLDHQGEDPGRIQRVLEKLEKARLVRLTPGDTTEDIQVEIAHEALVRNWPTLVEWLDEERVTLRHRQRLAAAADQWDRLGRDQSALLRGTLLSEAEKYDDLSELERAFVTLSRETERHEQQRELKQAQALAAEEARSARRLKWSVAFLAIGLLLALIGAASAFNGLQRANISAQVAQTSEANAITRRLAAAALSLESGAETGLLLAYEAAARTDDPETSQTLRRLIDQRIWVPTPLLDPGAETDGIRAAVSPDGRFVATAHRNGSVKLWADNGSLLVSHHPHKGEVVDVVFSPDGSQLASYGMDHTATVFDVPSGEQRFTLIEHTATLVSVDFSPDSLSVLTAAQDGQAFIWSAQDGQLLHRLAGDDEPLTAALFHPSGQYVATATQRGAVRLWRLESENSQLLEHPGMVRTIAFSPDGQYIATTCDDDIGRIWDLNGRLVATLSGHRDILYTISFSPDSKEVITGSLDRTAQVWSLAGERRLVLRGHADRVYVAFFTPDGQNILTGSRDGTARLWDQGGRLVTVLDGHTDVLFRVRINQAFDRIVTAGEDGIPRLWLRSTPPLAELSGHDDAVLAGAYSPDGRHIVTASADTTARLWEASTGQQEFVLTGHSASVRSSVYSPDGHYILTASDDGTARLWEATTGREEVILQGHTAPVRSAIFSADGEQIVTISDDATARVWRSPTGTLLATLVHESNLTAGAFRSDGQRIATSSLDGTARLWDITGNEVATLNHRDADPDMRVYALAFSSDNKWIATGGGMQRNIQGQITSTGIVRLWDANGNLIATLTGFSDEVTIVAFDPQSTFILAASRDRTIRGWPIDGPWTEPVFTVEGHRAEILSLQISPDGGYAVSGSRDGTAILWRDNQVVARFTNFDDRVTLATFSPDSRRVLVVSSDGTASQYIVDTEDLLRVTACRVGREMTNAEKDGYQVQQPLFNFANRQCPPRFSWE